MKGIFFWTIFWIVVGVGLCAMCGWCMVTLEDSVLQGLGVVVITILAFAAAVAFGWHLMTEREQQQHSWRGGNGPNTVCSYFTQQETVMVGKVPVTQDVTYTVCD